MTDGQTAVTTSLPRQLGVLGLWLLMINGMIGAGIFGVPAAAARLAGDFSPLLYVLCALLIAPIMLCFAELGSATRESGGPARYVTVAFGSMAGFQTGWALYIARLTAFAANLNLLLATLAHFLPGLQAGAARVAGLALLTALLAWLNIVGVQRAIQSLGGLTLLKLGPLLLLVLLGLVAVATPEEQLAPIALWPSADADLGAAVLLIIYAYVGFESGLIPGGEARNPQRDMPRALLMSLAVATLLYVLLQWICMALLDDLASSSRPLVELGELLLGPVGGVLLVLTVAASVGGNLLGSMFSAPRITFALAEQGTLPAALAAVHPRYRTPWISILGYAVLAWILASSGSFVWLAALSVLTRVLIYLACIAAMPRVRAVAPAGALRLPLGWLLPLLAIAACLLLLSQVTWQSVAATAVLLAVGSVLYLLARRRAGDTANQSERSGRAARGGDG